MRIKLEKIETIGKSKEVQYFTDAGVNINEHVRQGRTELWSTMEEAQKAAVRLNSYVYWVYTTGGIFSCYGVPK